MISVIVPVRTSETHLIDSIQETIKASEKLCSEELEVIYVVSNSGGVKARNSGATSSSGETLVFLDDDLIISPNFFSEVSEKSKNDYFVGGGVKHVKLTRKSLGIMVAMYLLYGYILWHQITLGAFWVHKDDFFAIGGFRSDKKFSDIDFAVRMQKYAKKNHRKFESLKESHIIWSTDKFDTYGDWHWIRGYNTGKRG